MVRYLARLQSERERLKDMALEQDIPSMWMDLQSLDYDIEEVKAFIHGRDTAVLENDLLVTVLHTLICKNLDIISAPANMTGFYSLLGFMSDFRSALLQIKNTNGELYARLLEWTGEDKELRPGNAGQPAKGI